MALPYSDPANPANPSPLFNDITAVRGDHMRANNNAIFADLTYLENEIAANWARTIYGDNAYGSTLVTDLNAITKSGFYTCYGAATGVPNADSSWFVIHQNSAVGTVSAYQRAVSFGTNIVYGRVKVSSTWGAWKEEGAEATGSEKMFFSDVAPRGWVFEDGKTLATSGGNYNGAVYYPLYAHIWDLVNRSVVPSTYLSAAKGASADADWAAGKKIYLPDRRATSPKGAGNQTINTRVKSGPEFGAVEEDQMQGHYHNFKRGTNAALGSGSDALATGGSDSTEFVRAAITDGTNGTPRTGRTTRDCTLGTNFIIKL